MITEKNISCDYRVENKLVKNLDKASLVGELNLLDSVLVLVHALEILLEPGVGAVGQGLVVEEDGLCRLVRLEELVPLLPVLDRLLQALGPSLLTATTLGRERIYL